VDSSKGGGGVNEKPVGLENKARNLRGEIRHRGSDLRKGFWGTFCEVPGGLRREQVEKKKRKSQKRGSARPMRDTRSKKMKREGDAHFIADESSENLDVQRKNAET